MRIEFEHLDNMDKLLRQMKELHGVDLTEEQLNEFLVEYRQLFTDAVAAVKDVDSGIYATWTYDIATGELTELFTPPQEEAREQLQRIAKETLYTLLNRYRTNH
jgi:hypothetical protein